MEKELSTRIPSLGAYTDKQLRCVLKSINQRQGKWNDLDIRSELQNIGREANLDEQDMRKLLNDMLDGEYVLIGNLQIGNPQIGNPQIGSPFITVSFGGQRFRITNELQLSDKGKSFSDKEV